MHLLRYKDKYPKIRIENFNSIIEKIQIKYGGHFSFVDALIFAILTKEVLEN